MMRMVPIPLRRKDTRQRISARVQKTDTKILSYLNSRVCSDNQFVDKAVIEHLPLNMGRNDDA